MPEQTKKSDDFRWGEILARLTSIDKSSGKHETNIDELRGEMTQGFLTLGREVSTYGQKLESHIGEDDGRFEKNDKSIDRLEGASPATPGLSGVSKGQVAGVAGSAGVLVLVLNWLREFFTATGGSPPT